MYTCDKKCYDFNNEHICKHIHKVHSLVVRNRKEAERYTESMSSTAMTQESAAPPDTEDMEDTNTDEIEIAYAESIFSPEKGWLQWNTTVVILTLHEYGHPF